MVMRWRAQIHPKKPPKLPGHPIRRPRGMRRGREKIEHRSSAGTERRQVVTEAFTITNFCKKFHTRDLNKK